MTDFLNYSAQPALPDGPDPATPIRVLVGPASVQDGSGGLVGQSLTLPAWDVLIGEQAGITNEVKP